MQPIVLNEKEYAEKCIANGSITSNPFYVLTTLAKYYYHVCGFRKQKIIILLTEFMNNNYPNYRCNKFSWDNSIDKIASCAGKHDLFMCDGIWITESELKVIAAINNKSLEKFAFTILCLAKLSNKKNPNNNNWVNFDAKDIFKLARISIKTEDRYKYFNKLYLRSLIEFPKKNDNLNCRVTFVNESDTKLLFISDFRELGYAYLKYRGENFINCSECGILIRGNRAGTKRYCKDCAAYKPKSIKTMTCVDCGRKFTVAGNNKRSIRCSECRTKRIKEYDRARKRK